MNASLSATLHDLTILLRLRLRLAFRRPHGRSKRRRIPLPSKSVIAGTMMLVVFCAITLSFAGRLSFLAATPTGRTAAAAALIGIAPAVFVLLFVAAIPVALLLLADRIDLTLLLLAPISPRLVLAERILSAGLGTTSLVLVIGGPILLALGQAAQLGLAFHILALLILLLLPIAPVSLVILLTVGVLHWIPPVRARTITAVLSVLFGLSSYAISEVSRQRWFSQGLEGLAAPPPGAWWTTLPLSWPGHALAAAVLNDFPSALAHLGAYLLFSAMIFTLAVVVAAHLCASGWATYQEIGRRSPRHGEFAAAGRAGRYPLPLPVSRIRQGANRPRPRWQILVAKEWLLLRRDPQTWARSLYALAGLGLGLYRLATGPRGESGLFGNLEPAFILVAALAFGSNLLIAWIAGPIVNREGYAFALLRLSPASAREIVSAKWIFCVLAALAIQAVLLIVGGITLRAPPESLLLAGLALGGLTAALTGGIITINLLWPRFDTDSPRGGGSRSARLIGSISGFAFTAAIVGLWFVGVTLGTEGSAIGALAVALLFGIEGLAIAAAARFAPGLLQSLLDGRRLTV